MRTAWVLLLVSTQAQAVCMAPPEQTPKNILTVVGNLTWGAVNTLAGGLVLAGATVAAPFSEELHLPRFRKAENGRQIGVDIGGGKNAHSFSLGLFQFDFDKDNYPKESYEVVSLHEGGHAYQSALLGPLYLPVVGLDYVLSGGGLEHNAILGMNEDDPLVERWAERMTLGECPSYVSERGKRIVIEVNSTPQEVMASILAVGN